MFLAASGNLPPAWHNPQSQTPRWPSLCRGPNAASYTRGRTRVDRRDRGRRRRALRPQPRSRVWLSCRHRVRPDGGRPGLSPEPGQPELSLRPPRILLHQDQGEASSPHAGALVLPGLGACCHPGNRSCPLPSRAPRQGDVCTVRKDPARQAGSPPHPGPRCVLGKRRPPVEGTCPSLQKLARMGLGTDSAASPA